MFFGIISISDDFKLALFSRNKSIHLYKFEAMTSHDIKVLLNRVQSKGLIAFEVNEQRDILKLLYSRSSQVAFCSLDDILLPYLLHNDVSHALKILAKEILLTWITRHIVYASLEVYKIEKIMKVINDIDTISLSTTPSSSLLKGLDVNNNNNNNANNNNANTKILNSINDIMYIYDDYSDDNSRKRKFLGNNDDSMIKKALKQIMIFNSIESNNKIVQDDQNTISDSIVIANDSAANNNYEELLVTCKACHVQINKYKVTSIGASSKLKAIVTSVITIIDNICNIESNRKKLEALNVLGLWLADDEILVQISEHYHKNDHIRTIVLVVFVGMLLLKARCICAPAARTFLKAIELMIKCRADIAIAGLLSRVIRFPNHTNKSNNDDCPIKIMTTLIGNGVNTIPGNFQFELFQRSARQLLSKQQKDILLNNTFSNVDCNIVEVEFLKVLDGVLSPLAIMKSNDYNINIDTIFDEWKRLIGISTLTSTVSNSPILWDNENLKILNSVLTGCSEISVLTVRFILINLDDVAVGNINICSSINLAAVLHTITTKCITVITNNEDLMKLARGLLLRCSNPMAKNALAVLNNTVK